MKYYCGGLTRGTIVGVKHDVLLWGSNMSYYCAGLTRGTIVGFNVRY